MTQANKTRLLEEILSAFRARINVLMVPLGALYEVAGRRELADAAHKLALCGRVDIEEILDRHINEPTDWKNVN